MTLKNDSFFSKISYIYFISYRNHIEIIFLKNIKATFIRTFKHFSKLKFICAFMPSATQAQLHLLIQTRNEISILIHTLGFFIVHTIINLAKFCQSILGIYNRILKIAFKAFIRPRSDWKTFFRGRRCCSICFDTHGHNREKFSWICGVAKIFSSIQFWNKQINIQENYTQTKVIKI